MSDPRVDAAVGVADSHVVEAVLAAADKVDPYRLPGNLLVTDRNRVDPETAERNRTTGEGGYTFHAPIAKGASGLGLVVAALRIGAHAHLEVSTGEIVQRRPSDEYPEVNRGFAGRLVMRWAQWEVLRSILAGDDHVHIAEVQRPTARQIDFHVTDHRCPSVCEIVAGVPKRCQLALGHSPLHQWVEALNRSDGLPTIAEWADGDETPRHRGDIVLRPEGP